MRARLLAAALGLALVAGGCSGGDDEAGTAGNGASADPAAQGVAGSDVVDGAPVQDVWTYERVQTVDAEGGLVDITGDMTAGLAGDEAGAIELLDGVTFTPVPALDAWIRDDDSGAARDDLEVVAGIVETADGSALQVVATPTGDVSVEADDMIMLDLAHLDLPAGAPLVVDFGFAQGLPGSDESPDASGLELLRERMAAGRINWFGVDGPEGEELGLVRVFGAVPGDRSATNPGLTNQGATNQGATSQGAANQGPTSQGVTSQGAAWHGDSVVVTAEAARTGSQPSLRTATLGPDDGGIPTKAKPAIDPIKKAGGCKGLGINCVSKYHRNQIRGFKKAWDDLWKINIGPDPDPCVGCGGAGGDPHLRTFDGLRYDLQLVGEFVLAASDDLEVQTRFSPLGGTSVSVVTAVAVRLGEQRITVRDDREPTILLDGEELTREQVEEGVELDAGTVRLLASTLVVSTDAGAEVRVARALSGAGDVLVAPGPDGTDWTGLLGDDDGDLLNDLRLRDGEPLPVEDGVRVVETPGVDRLYDEFGASWRIDEADALFDRTNGETTETFTDLDFPANTDPMAGIDAATLAIARALCRETGITDQFWFDACVLDYALTGDISFLVGIQELAGDLDPALSGWSAELEGDSAGPSVVDAVSGHLLAPASVGDKGTVTALDLESGEEAWTIDTARSGCVAVAASGPVVVTVPGEDEAIALSLRDPATGAEQGRIQTQLRSCDAMLVHEDTVVLRDGNELLGVDVSDSTTLFELDLERIASTPVLSGDGQVWLLRKGEDGHSAVRVDLGTGTPVEIALDVPGPFGNVAATEDGLVLGFKGDGSSADGLLRINRTGEVWRADWPVTADGKEFDKMPSGPLAVEGDLVALYQGFESLVLDLTNGEVVGSVTPSSFSNNGGRLVLVDGAVVVGPFSGDAWIEAWRPGVEGPAWTAELPGEGVHDAKVIGPVTPTGQVIVSSPRNVEEGDAHVVAKVGPGS